jgi:hypothetical protein
MQRKTQLGVAILVAGAAFSSACSSDSTSQSQAAVVDGGGGAKDGSGGAHAGSGGAHATTGGAHTGATGGLHSGGSGGRFVEAGTEDAAPHGGASGKGGGIIDSGLDGSACGPKQGMCCCAGDNQNQPVCSDGGWTCLDEGYFPFYGDDCTRQNGPCMLPPGPEGGRDGSSGSSRDASSGDGGICSTCKAWEVCVEHETQGGALILADAGRCPSGRVPVSNFGRTVCELAPSFECAAIPSTCNNPPGTPALAHCACARSLCGSANLCEDVSLTLMKCTLQVP